MKKDYCSGVPDRINGTDLTPCCKKHDNMCGMRGTYNPFTPHIEFYKCLKKSGVGRFFTIVYTLGGTLGAWLKYPYLAYQIYKYRKANK